MNYAQASLASLALGLCFLEGQEPQVERPAAIHPVLLDKSLLSGVDLAKVELSDEPDKDFFQGTAFRGEDLAIYVVSTESWVNRMENFPFDEFIYMFNGQASVRPASGDAQVFNSHEHFFAPRGFTGEWELIAGDNYHYELSVIARERADSSEVDPAMRHALIDPVEISGAEISLDSAGRFRKQMVRGAELTVALHGESPGSTEFLEPVKETLYHLLSGQVRTTSADGESHTFYANDFFVLPKGWIGTWIGEGHGLVKYLTVERTR